MLDKMDRALHNVLCGVKWVLKRSKLVPGGGRGRGGAVGLSRQPRPDCGIHGAAGDHRVHQHADGDPQDDVGERRQGRVKAGAPAVGGLRLWIVRPETDEGLKYIGLNLVEGAMRNNLAAKVVEPAIYKIKSLRFVREAAITTPRINDRKMTTMKVRRTTGHRIGAYKARRSDWPGGWRRRRRGTTTPGAPAGRGRSVQCPVHCWELCGHGMMLLG